MLVTSFFIVALLTPSIAETCISSRLVIPLWSSSALLVSGSGVGDAVYEGSCGRPLLGASPCT